jgi:hypothetical protein
MKIRFKSVLLFLVGTGVGMITANVLHTSSGESRDTGSGDVLLRTSYVYGNEANSEAQVAGVSVPANARDVFYGITG